MKQATVLVSGGVDSTTLLHFVRTRLRVPRVHALSFAYGQKHVRELDMAAWQAERVGVETHRTVDISFFGRLVAGGTTLTEGGAEVPDLDRVPAERRHQPPTYVPNRNMLLLSIATGYAESSGMTDVFYGAQAQDEYGYWDCTRDFVDGINAVLGLNRGRSVTIHAPFVDMSKADVVKLGLELGIDYGHTWTCYRGGQVPCGTCPSCVERAKAFEAAGAADPLARG